MCYVLFISHYNFVMITLLFYFHYSLFIDEKSEAERVSNLHKLVELTVYGTGIQSWEIWC